MHAHIRMHRLHHQHESKCRVCTYMLVCMHIYTHTLHWTRISFVHETASLYIRLIQSTDNNRISQTTETGSSRNTGDKSVSGTWHGPTEDALYIFPPVCNIYAYMYASVCTQTYRCTQECPTWPIKNSLLLRYVSVCVCVCVYIYVYIYIYIYIYMYVCIYM